MNAQTFLENFGHLAEAPGGVQKLREMVLELAMMGRLVSQSLSDEPAIELMDRIKAEWSRLLSHNAARKGKPLAAIESPELPFALPQSWAWVRLGFLVDYQGAQKVAASDIPDDAWLLDLADIEKDTSRIIQRVSFKERRSKSTKAKFATGDVLYGKLRPYLNKVVVADADGYCTTEIIPLRTIGPVEPQFLKLALKRPDFLRYVNERTYGINLPRLGTEDARNALVPLPPTAEQRRIVAKVDELMALCDELEARQEERRAVHVRLNTAALERLTAAASPAEFAPAWHRVRDHFDLLYSSCENVAQLRQAILQLAVQGKLVPQDPKDEPAEKVVEEVLNERSRLLAAGLIKGGRQESAPSKDELGFALPASWTAASVGDLFDVSGGIQKQPKRQPKRNSFPYLRVANVYRGRLDLSEIKRFELFEGELERWRLEKGDLLIVEGNGSEGEIGRCAVWGGELENCVHQNHIIRCRPIGRTSSEFTLRFLNSPSGIEEMKRLAITTSGLYSLSVGKVRGIVIPIPPVREQRRIIARLDSLMQVCDQLERDLMDARGALARFSQSSVSAVLGGAAA